MSDLTLPPGLACVPFDDTQLSAMRKVRDWVHNPSAPRIYRVYGCAGVGKTSIARAAVYGTSALYAAPTGKAAYRMRQTGCEDASTLHLLLYRPSSVLGKVVFTYAPQPRVHEADVVVVDEGSMVDETVGIDLLTAAKKVLVLCDPFQLPPVSGVGYFGGEADVLLTKVHRQALNSPVLYAATHVREQQTSEILEGHNEFGRLSVLPRSMQQRALDYVDQVLVGRNSTRRALNTEMRLRRGNVLPMPVAGDKLVCVQNNQAKAMYNGGLWSVADTPGSLARDGGFTMVVQNLDDPSAPQQEVSTNLHVLTEESGPAQMRRGSEYAYFNYGYAITVHKSQGSEWQNVLLFDESKAFEGEQLRWLYTGLTRASKELYIIKD